MKICSCRFFLEDLFWRLNFWKNFNEDLFMDIFPWRFILRDFSIEVLEIFIEDLFIGEFSFWKWRFSFMITKWRRWRWIRNDEDLFMMIFFFFLKNLSFGWEQLWLEVDADCWISPCLIPIKRLFQLAMNFFIEMNWKYLPNAPNLGHIPCLDWTWVHLMLRPLGNMNEDHGPRSLVLAKYFSFSSLLETNYQENIFGQCL